MKHLRMDRILIRENEAGSAFYSGQGKWVKKSSNMKSLGVIGN